MEDGLLSLKWNNHKSTFFHILSSLRKKETYTDATLACEGKFFPVHKLVMSTCSDYFSEVFERTSCKSPVVILKDIRHHDLEALLDYMYLGEVDVKQSELAGLIKAAECLRIKGLAVPDEDPTLSHKKSSTLSSSQSNEGRASPPSAKRLRGENSGGSGFDSHHQHYAPHSNKVRRSASPNTRSTSNVSTSVPSQSVNSSDTLTQVPAAHSIPPSSYSSDSKHPSSSSSTHKQQQLDQSLVPIDMIKVEAEEDGNSGNSSSNNNNSQLRRHQDGLPPPDQGGGRDEPRGEGGGGGEKNSLTNNYGEFSAGHAGEIEKEEHDQIDTFNGADQMAGPSGVQGGSQMMNWGEEEGSFPHNLFSGEDSSHQQVVWVHDSVQNIKEMTKALTNLREISLLNLKTLSSRTNHFLDDDEEVIDLANGNSSDDSLEFEGFEKENFKLSEFKKKMINETRNLISKSQNTAHLDSSSPAVSSSMFNSPVHQPPHFPPPYSVLQSSPSLSKNSPLSSVHEFHEYTPFEVLAEEFREELGIVPFEVSFREEDSLEYFPPEDGSSTEDEDEYICNNCNEIFENKELLDLHLMKFASCSAPSCPVCPFRGKDIMNHVLYHSKINDQGFRVCLLCDKGPILTANKHLEHLRLVHS